MRSNIARPDAGRPRGNTVLEAVSALALGASLVVLLPRFVCWGGTPARRMQCGNNLKQIGLAIYSYEQEHGAFPPAYTVDAQGRRLHSWRTLILPYMEEEEAKTLYRSIDLSRPWDDPANATARAARPSCYRCPESKRPGDVTSYLAVVGPSYGLLPEKVRRLSELAGRPSHTLMVVETGEAEAVPWMAPLDADEARVLQLGPDSDIHHNSWTHWMYVDGSVRVLPATPWPRLTGRGGDR